MDGQCMTGCAQYFTGDNCQGNVLCALTARCAYNSRIWITEQLLTCLLFWSTGLNNFLITGQNFIVFNSVRHWSIWSKLYR